MFNARGAKATLFVNAYFYGCIYAMADQLKKVRHSRAFAAPTHVCASVMLHNRFAIARSTADV